MGDFGMHLAAAIEAKGHTRLAFARLAGCPTSLVSEVIRGKRKAPLARLESWSRLLFQTEAERLAFVRAGALAHAPAVIQAWVAELRTGPASPRRRG
ncbi:MAG: helix-turn-helix transcriptional regulator [Planctomycetes bacterium]|nr:helix-turn-helix transcriptional regulator [Planctomycetota bacterium]